MKKERNIPDFDLPGKVYKAYKKDFQNGTVTLGNICSADCFFCSQKWNPPGVIQNLDRLLTWDEIKHFTDRYLPRVDIMGTARHVNSGEFFLHPDAIKILLYFKSRQKLRSHRIIISNGMNVTRDHIRIVKKCELHFQLSLNAPDAASRMAVMKGSYLENKNAVDTVAWLEKNGIHYDITMIPFKSYLRNGTIESIFKNLKNHHVNEFHFFRPGYSRLTPAPIVENLRVTDEELTDFRSYIAGKYRVEVMIEGVPSRSRRMAEYLRIINSLSKVLDWYKKEKLFLCSQKAEKTVAAILKKMRVRNYRCRVVPSRVFGGSVDCAGLLTVQDYIYAMENYLKRHDKPEVVFLPHESFDINKEDLSMESVDRLKDIFKMEFLPIKSKIDPV